MTLTAAHKRLFPSRPANPSCLKRTGATGVSFVIFFQATADLRTSLAVNLMGKEYIHLGKSACRVKG